MGEGGEVCGEDVSFKDLYVGVIAEFESELWGESAVQFNGDESFGAGGEDFCDGTVAGADFDDGAGGEVAESVGDGVTGLIVYEEVLA